MAPQSYAAIVLGFGQRRTHNMADTEHSRVCGDMKW